MPQTPKTWGNGSVAQADWNETNPDSKSFICNRPEIVNDTDFVKALPRKQLIQTTTKQSGLDMDLWVGNIYLTSAPTEYYLDNPICELNVYFNSDFLNDYCIAISNAAGQTSEIQLAQEWSIFFKVQDTEYTNQYANLTDGGGRPSINIGVKGTNYITPNLFWAFGKPQFRGGREYLLTFKLIGTDVYILWSEWTRVDN